MQHGQRNQSNRESLAGRRGVSSLAFFFLIVTTAVSANETSWHTLQSGSPFGPTPIHDHGIHGEGQVIAILDTGLDYDNCYFAEPDGSRPPINTGTPLGGLADSNIDPSRRKVIAYDFVYSCNQYPGANGCDDPSNPKAWDNQGHGTHAAAAAAGDKGTPIVHDFYDSIAPGAKLVIQDAGYIGGDNCSQRPGIGCPVSLTPILTQAYRQGVRIHSNSWGDRQGVPPFLPPPTANYSASAREVDAFVWTHPDILVVFNTGNASTLDIPPPSSLSAPGCAKNTLQVGGTRTQTAGDDTLAAFTLLGPARDGRIKPDLVGPAIVIAGDSDLDVRTGNCDISSQPGTSWSSPTIAGAAALVRQYFTDGYYPSGAPEVSDRFAPSAALLKATLIAAARQVPYRGVAAGATSALPVPSNEQGWGFPVLGDVLWFPGQSARLRLSDVASASGLAEDESTSMRVSVKAGTPFKAVLVWTDPPGVARTAADATPELVNDLDLKVTTPTGVVLLGNESLHPGQADRLNNVEVVSMAAPPSGVFTIAITAAHLGLGPRQGYALVLTGDLGPAPRMRAARH